MTHMSIHIIINYCNLKNIINELFKMPSFKIWIIIKHNMLIKIPMLITQMLTLVINYNCTAIILLKQPREKKYKDHTVYTRVYSIIYTYKILIVICITKNKK